MHEGAQVYAGGGLGLVVSATQNEDILLIAVARRRRQHRGRRRLGRRQRHDATTTKAHVDANVTVAVGRSAGVAVSATDTTSIFALSGTVGVGGTAGVGAGVDVEVVTKDTEAWIGKDVDITVTGDVTVDATSSEDAISISAGGELRRHGRRVSVNAAVSVFDITTQAFVADGTSAGDRAKITADGSVRVAADETLTLDVIGGNISGGGTAAVGAAVARAGRDEERRTRGSATSPR